MTKEEAARILDPETTREAQAEIEYYGGFRGEEAVLEAAREARRIAAEALRHKPTGDPLTPEQLRKMDGQPVWVLDKEKPQDSGWTIWAEEFNDLLSEGSYGVTWIAYAYRPTHIDLEAWGCPLCNRSRVISFKAWEDEDAYQDGGPFVQGGALFCPRCGKPRTPEARAELEKRLRGIKREN